MGDEVGICAAGHPDPHADDEHPVKEEVAEGIQQRRVEGHPGVSSRDVEAGEDAVDQDQRDIPDTDRKESLDVGEKDLCPAEEDDDRIHEDLPEQGDKTAEDPGHDDGRSEDPAGFFIFPFPHFC